MERDQELIDRIRHDLGLPKDKFTDDEIWEKTKYTFITQRSAFGISVGAFKKSVCDLVFGFNRKNHNKFMRGILKEK